MARIDDLREARDLAWASALASDPEKRAPLLAQWRALEATIAELEGAEQKAVATGDPADEIAARRAARGGSSARAGRARPRSS